MKNGIRVVLVAPYEDSRTSLLAQLESMDQVWVAEVCVTYSEALGRVTEIRPDLTIAIVDIAPAEGAQFVQTLSANDPDGPILAACCSNDRRANSTLIQYGARESLTLPVENEALYKIIRRLTNRPAAAVAASLPVPIPAEAQPGNSRSKFKAKTIAVTGASGEVGCTSLAVNLAATLAKTAGQEVVIADFELVFGAVDTLLDILPENTLMEIVHSGHRLDSTLLKRMLCRHASGLYVLPRPFELQDAARLDPESLSQTLTLLRSSFSTVVIDTSKHLQTTDFLAFDAADVILVVVQLDPVSVKNTARLIRCLHEFDGLAQRVQIVANRVGSLRSSVALEAAEDEFQMPVSWQIPNATKTFHLARDRGVPIEVVSPRSEAQRTIASMAKALVPCLTKVEPKPQRRFFLSRAFQREA